MKDLEKYYVFESIWGKRITVLANCFGEAENKVSKQYHRLALMKLIEVI